MTTAGRRWTLIIAAFLLANVLASMVLVFFSHGDTDRRVLPDYYKRALEVK